MFLILLWTTLFIILPLDQVFGKKKKKSLFRLHCRNNSVIIASSIQPSRLQKVETIENPVITISGKKRSLLAHDDSFLLEFSAFDKWITLNLIPNVDLFHPSAQLTIFNTNGSTNGTELLQPHDHFVYKGHVNDVTHQWARIIMRNDLEYVEPKLNNNKKL